MSVLPIQNVSFTKSKMSVLQNPKCRFYQIQSVSFIKSIMSVLPIQNVSFTNSKMSVLQAPKCQFCKIQNVSFTSKDAKKKRIKTSKLKKDTKEKNEEKGIFSQNQA